LSATRTANTHSPSFKERTLLNNRQYKAASKIMPKETSGSIASTNIAITKTICSALSDMRVKP
jgi:hypothetical protein